jgi:ABC-type branched-subunit amino acid transport system ATPase component
MSTIKTRAAEIIGLINGVVDEMNYAQRRLFEIRLAVLVNEPELMLVDEAEIEQLEELYRLETEAEAGHRSSTPAT